jgi:hypothetical protein
MEFDKNEGGSVHRFVDCVVYAQYDAKSIKEITKAFSEKHKKPVLSGMKKTSYSQTLDRLAIVLCKLRVFQLRFRPKKLRLWPKKLRQNS